MRETVEYRVPMSEKRFDAVMDIFAMLQVFPPCVPNTDSTHACVEQLLNLYACQTCARKMHICLYVKGVHECTGMYVLHYNHSCHLKSTRAAYFFPNIHIDIHGIQFHRMLHGVAFSLYQEIRFRRYMMSMHTRLHVLTSNRCTHADRLYTNSATNSCPATRGYSYACREDIRLKSGSCKRCCCMCFQMHFSNVTENYTTHLGCAIQTL
jgi:hypothetical protein